MKFTRILMTASAAMMVAVGLVATFAPDIVLRSLDARLDPGLMLLVQVTGGLYMGFAALNWMGRNNLIGGIYGRPIAVANLMHFMTAGLAIMKSVFRISGPPALWAMALAYALLAIAFGIVLMRHPLPPPREPEAS